MPEKNVHEAGFNQSDTHIKGKGGGGGGRALI